MRRLDTRYDQEHRILATAIRMISYEARTNTICACTGLTDDQVRKMYKTYVAERGAANIRRRRGKSPHQIECLIRNAEVQMHSAVLAGAFVMVGLLDKDGHSYRSCTREAAERLCDAYELYRQHLDPQELDFEHAWFLWQALEKGAELQSSACTNCGCLLVLDRFAVRARPCPWCQTKQRNY